MGQVFVFNQDGKTIDIYDDGITKLTDELRRLNQVISDARHRRHKVSNHLKKLQTARNPFIGRLAQRTLPSGRVEIVRLTGLPYPNTKRCYDSVLLKKDGSESNSKRKHRIIDLTKWSGWQIIDNEENKNEYERNLKAV